MGGQAKYDFKWQSGQGGLAKSDFWYKKVGSRHSKICIALIASYCTLLGTQLKYSLKVSG